MIFCCISMLHSNSAFIFSLDKRFCNGFSIFPQSLFTLSFIIQKLNNMLSNFAIEHVSISITAESIVHILCLTAGTRKFYWSDSLSQIVNCQDHIGRLIVVPWSSLSVCFHLLIDTCFVLPIIFIPLTILLCCKDYWSVKLKILSAFMALMSCWNFLALIMKILLASWSCSLTVLLFVII